VIWVSPNEEAPHYIVTHHPAPCTIFDARKPENIHLHSKRSIFTMAANGVHKTNANVFPESLKSLKEADPEMYSILQDEKARQW
jgi:hypothetical protein